jgi:hypothetical protein
MFVSACKITQNIANNAPNVIFFNFWRKKSPQKWFCGLFLDWGAGGSPTCRQAGRLHSN